MTVLWLVSNTKGTKRSPFTNKVFTDKEAAINAALSIPGRRGLAIPTILNEETATTTFTQSILEICIRNNRVDDVIDKDTQVHHSPITKGVRVYTYIKGNIIWTLDNLRHRGRADASFAIHTITTTNRADHIDAKDRLINRLMNLGPNEPRYFLMECQDIYE